MSGRGRMITRLWGSGMALSLALVPDSQVNVVQPWLGHCFKVYLTPSNLLFKANALSGKSLMIRLIGSKVQHANLFMEIKQYWPWSVLGWVTLVAKQDFYFCGFSFIPA